MPSAAVDISFSGLVAVSPQLVFTCLGSQAAGSGLGPLCLMDSAGILRGSGSSKERRNTRQSSPSSCITSAVIHNQSIFHPIHV